VFSFPLATQVEHAGTGNIPERALIYEIALSVKKGVERKVV
jgi:hypothetical protein